MYGKCEVHNVAKKVIQVDEGWRKVDVVDCPKCHRIKKEAQAAAMRSFRKINNH